MAKKGSTTATAPLKWKQAESLLNNLLQEKKYNTALMCSIGFHWGLRIGDILNLTWQQITQQEFTIVEHKTKKKRTLTNSKRNYEIIRQAFENLPVRPDANDFVFVEQRKTMIGSKPISVTAANKRIKQALHKYAIKTKNPSSHTLRKTFARRVYDDSNDKTETLIYLMDILNHANIKDTKKYIGLQAEKKKATYESIGGGKVSVAELINF